MMTERKKLKNELSKLKAQRRTLPMLIDCSLIYGDNYYTVDDLIIVDNKISILERQIAQIDFEAELNGG